MKWALQGMAAARKPAVLSLHISTIIYIYVYVIVYMCIYEHMYRSIYIYIYMYHPLEILRFLPRTLAFGQTGADKCLETLN